MSLTQGDSHLGPPAQALAEKCIPHQHIRGLLFIAGSVVALLSACSSNNPATGTAIERGRYGTVAYELRIESDEPGVRIETNKAFAGSTPFALKIFGDRDGTFHNFGEPNYIIQAIPDKPGQHLQTKIFHNGEAFVGDDKIPKRIYFDMVHPENTAIEGKQEPKG